MAINNPLVLSGIVLALGCMTSCTRTEVSTTGTVSPPAPTSPMNEPTSPEPTADAPAPPTLTFAKPSDDELRQKLTPDQWYVVRENGTERPFTNEYWKHDEEGIYVDIVTGKPLFSSRDKFDTDCGWPGFAKPIEDHEVKELNDLTHGMVRTEVRSATGDAHLGHVFDDGPPELGGKRYCINSASIRFIPKEKMSELGYGAWLKDVEKPKP